MLDDSHHASPWLQHQLPSLGPTPCSTCGCCLLLFSCSSCQGVQKQFFPNFLSIPDYCSSSLMKNGHNRQNEKVSLLLSNKYHLTTATFVLPSQGHAEIWWSPNSGTLFGNLVFAIVKLRWGHWDAPSSNMTGVLIRRGETRAEGRWHEDTQEDAMWWQRQASESFVCKPGAPRIANNIINYEKDMENSPLDPSGGVWSCQQIEFRLPASRIVRE